MKIAPIAETNVSRPDSHGAQAEAELQHQRQQKRRRADADAKQRAADDAGAIRREPEQIEIEQRVLVAALVHDVADERGEAEHERRGRELDGHEMLAERREAEHRGAEPAAREREAEPVERRRLLARIRE